MTNDPVEVCPLARGVMLPERNPYPLDYGGAFACSTVLCPRPRPSTLQCLYPIGKDMGYHVPRTYDKWMGKVPPIRRWRYCLREQKTQLLCRATYLLVQAYQHVWLGCHHDV